MIEPKQHFSVQRRPSLVVLIGFRATGKTAVGRKLANLTGYRFIDTDEIIVERLGCSIAESVSRNGWQLFRRLEEQVLLDCVGLQKTILATGGGAVLHRKAWHRLRRRGFVVWLQAEAATLLARLQVDPNTAGQRPSLRSGISDSADPAVELSALLAERELLYRAGSDLAVDTEHRGPEALAAYIFQKLILTSTD